MKKKRDYRECGLMALAALLVLLAYSNTFQSEYHFDDISKIKNNANDHVTSLSAEGLKNLLFQQRPVAHLTFALNYYLGGPDVWGYHVFNVGIHLLCAFLLFLFVRRAVSANFSDRNIHS